MGMWDPSIIHPIMNFEEKKKKKKIAAAHAPAVQEFKAIKQTKVVHC